jgi:integrase
MRRGELLNARTSHINWDASTLHIPTTKTGIPRTIPLTPRALNVLRDVAASKLINQLLFDTTASAVNQSWKRLAKRAGLTNLHFHDLRHEAVTRLFEFGLSLPEVALVSGHQDPRMLFRYTHIKASDVAKKLENKGQLIS